MTPDPRTPGLDPGLKSFAGHLDPEDRRKLAVVYRRWAEQLEATADAMDRGELRPGEQASAPEPENLVAFPSPKD